MINETFVASTPKKAYEEATKKYGDDIKLVSAKQIKYDDGEVRSEITVAIPKKIFKKRSELKKVREQKKEEEERLVFELEGLKKELVLMKEELAKPHKVVEKAKKTKPKKIEKKIKNLFFNKGISNEWLELILAPLKQSNILEDEVLLVSYLLEEIDRSLKIVDEDLSEQKIIMLVGATGVGKTTTIAKLSARYAYLLEKNYKVALLNLDSYKVGAHEQLAHYAGIMQVEHIALNNVKAYEESLEKLEHYDIILVDTAGMSPYDTQKFIYMIEFLQLDIPKKVEINLVIPATLKYEDMSDIYNHFSFLNLHSVIISKFDETRQFGVLLNFMLLYKLPMSYFCVGQEVPDDLRLASKEYLLEKFIGDLDAG